MRTAANVEKLGDIGCEREKALLTGAENNHSRT
jgi:hypothetical protein